MRNHHSYDPQNLRKSVDLKKKLIIAIDGPSGAGKSTLSKVLAKQLDYVNIDTGAMYRSVALLAQEQDIDPQNTSALKKLCGNLSIEFIRYDDSEAVLANGRDVTSLIRSPQVSLLTAQIASCKEVRDAMVRMQRHMGESGGVVLEGRDIGTVVFPDADVKFFLSATAQERGQRRYQELLAKGMKVDLQQTIREVEARDAVDSERLHAPLIQAADAIVIDSTMMTIDEVLKNMLAIVELMVTDQAKKEPEVE